jgi:anti-sigma factor RsiW
MNCSKTRKLISPYIDGELSEVKKRELEDHMKGCEECRAEMEEMKGLRQLFVNTDKFEAPYGFHGRVLANVNTSKPGWRSGISIPVRLAEALTVLGLVAVGVMSGTLLVKGLIPEKAGYEMASLHLDVFDSTPPGTLGGAYLAMTEGRNEK